MAATLPGQVAAVLLRTQGAQPQPPDLRAGEPLPVETWTRRVVAALLWTNPCLPLESTLLPQAEKMQERLPFWLGVLQRLTWSWSFACYNAG